MPKYSIFKNSITVKAFSSSNQFFIIIQIHKKNPSEDEIISHINQLIEEIGDVDDDDDDDAEAENIESEDLINIGEDDEEEEEDDSKMDTS